jgi:hypothetical protein
MSLHYKSFSIKTVARVSIFLLTRCVESERTGTERSGRVADKFNYE